MTSVPRSFTGGCHCGAVRYKVMSRPLAMLNCHCRDCQQMSGGPYTPVVYVSAKVFRITKGELRHYSTPSARGGANLRGFCAECGSRVTGAQSERGIGITASSHDDPGWFRPTMHLWTCDTQPWDVLESDLPKFDQYPPAK
jgi:hypothetical protein